MYIKISLSIFPVQFPCLRFVRRFLTFNACHILYYLDLNHIDSLAYSVDIQDIMHFMHTLEHWHCYAETS